MYAEYRLEILKQEIQIIDNTIGRLDKIILQTKNWAITIWAGSVALMLKESKEEFLLFSLFIPLIFWISHVRWAKALLEVSYRQSKISEFLNSKEFDNFFETQSLNDFKIFDPIGKQYKDDVNFKKETGYWQAVKYKDTSLIYIGLVLATMALFMVVK